VAVLVLVCQGIDDIIHLKYALLIWVTYRYEFCDELMIYSSMIFIVKFSILFFKIFKKDKKTKEQKIKNK